VATLDVLLVVVQTGASVTVAADTIEGALNLVELVLGNLGTIEIVVVAIWEAIEGVVAAALLDSDIAIAKAAIGANKAEMMVVGSGDINSSDIGADNILRLLWNTIADAVASREEEATLASRRADNIGDTVVVGLDIVVVVAREDTYTEADTAILNHTAVEVDSIVEDKMVEASRLMTLDEVLDLLTEPDERDLELEDVGLAVVRDHLVEEKPVADIRTSIVVIAVVDSCASRLAIEKDDSLESIIASI
jgi:hypothetical protein